MLQEESKLKQERHAIQNRNKLYTDDEAKLKTIIEEGNNSCSVTH